jgi:hypothetical protein
MLIVLSAAEIVDILDGTHSLSMLSETRRDSSQFCIFRSVTGVVGIHLLTMWPKSRSPWPAGQGRNQFFMLLDHYFCCIYGVTTVAVLEGPLSAPVESTVVT